MEKDLQEKSNVTIKEIRYTKQSLIVGLQVNEKEELDYYKGSYFLRNILETNNIDIASPVIKLIVGPTKTSPTKNKCRVFYM